MIMIERGSRWTGSRGRTTGRARAGTATPSRLLPPAARTRPLPVPTPGWPGSPGTTRARPRRPPARWPCSSTSCRGRARRCPGATGDELVGLLRAWAAIESWAAAAKLGVIREIIRREAPPSPGADHGDLPEMWSASLRYELAGALACSTQSAETTASLAWQLGARLPRIAARLEDGTLTSPKARAVTETLEQLADPDAAAAEALIADQLAGKTYTQVLRLAEQAALTVDPHLAERRREHAQKNYARVSFFREQAGTAGLSGRDLPPDEALAAMATVNARADQYKESGVFGDTPMDVLRARAYLDLINGLPAADRVAIAEQHDDDAQAWAAACASSGFQAESASDDAHPGPEARANPGDCPCAECDGSCVTPDDDPDGSGHADDDDPDQDDPDDGPRPDDEGDGGGPGAGGSNDGGGGGSGSGGTGGTGPRPGAPPAGTTHERHPADLIVPLATLLGLAERPGDIHGFGLLDPALARDLATTAAASPRTEVCVTVTSPEGYAIAHGCARPARTTPQPGPAASPVALPARLNLTIPATTLPGLPGRLGQPHRPLVLHPAHTARQTGNPRRLRHLDAHPPRRARADRAPGPGAGLRMRPPVRDPRLPAQRPAPPPRPDQRRHLHLPALQPARPRIRLRAWCAMRCIVV